MRADGKLRDVKLTGYYEADFLSAGVTSNNNQTTVTPCDEGRLGARLRLTMAGPSPAVGDADPLYRKRKGIDNLSTARPMTIDPNYTVGFTFARTVGRPCRQGL